MGKTVVHTDKAPAAIGPYSQAVKLETDLMFTSGQIGISPATGEMVEGIEAQTLQVLKNLEAILHAEGGTMKNVLKTTVYLSDMGNFAAMNEIYKDYFPEEPPARSTVEVSALPKGALVEIDCIARV